MKQVIKSGLLFILTLLLMTALIGCSKDIEANDSSPQNGPVKSNTVETPIAP
ncbi:MAG: hypothetical protein FWC54_05965 [Actinomycetia bacterium]|nr:hypothetical protein [Actinomycetes bacterium]